MYKRGIEMHRLFDTGGETDIKNENVNMIWNELTTEMSNRNTQENAINQLKKYNN